MQLPESNQESPGDIQNDPTIPEEISIVEKCPDCGKPVEPDWVYCGYCSHKLLREGEEIDPQPPVPNLVPPKAVEPVRKTRWLTVAEILGLLLIVAAIIFFTIAFANK